MEIQMGGGGGDLWTWKSWGEGGSGSFGNPGGRGGKKNRAFRRGCVDFFWNNPLRITRPTECHWMMHVGISKNLHISCIGILFYIPQEMQFPFLIHVNIVTLAPFLFV